MSVTIEKLEGLERSLQLELPWADIEAAVQKRLQNVPVWTASAPAKPRCA